MSTRYVCPHPGCGNETHTPDDDWIVVRRVVDSEPLAPEQVDAYCCARHAILGLERRYLQGVPL